MSAAAPATAAPATTATASAAASTASAAASSSSSSGDAKAEADAKARRKARKKNQKKKRAANKKAAAGDDDDGDADGADDADDDGGNDGDAKVVVSTGAKKSSEPPKILSKRPAPAQFIVPPALLPSPVFQKTEFIEVKAIPNKGKGCIAAKDIAVGTCILSEDGIWGDFHASRGAAPAAAKVAAELLTRDDCSDLYFENDSTKLAGGGIKLYAAPPEQKAKGVDDARWSMAMAQVTTNCFVMKLREDQQQPAADAKGSDSKSAAAAKGPTTTSVTVGDVTTTTTTPADPTDPCDSRLFLYPLAARFNHSCWPNVHIIQKNGKSQVYALESVKAGTELCICYRDEFLWLPTKRRQVMLKLSHLFDCRCVRCAPTAAAPSPALNEAFLESTTPSPLSTANRELMETMYTEAEKVHGAYSTLDDVRDGVEQWTAFVKQFSGKQLHRCHWKLFHARKYLIEALQTLSANDTGGALSSKHRKVLLEVVTEQLQALQLVVPVYHNINVIYFKTLLLINKNKLPCKELEETWAKLKSFFNL